MDVLNITESLLSVQQLFQHKQAFLFVPVRNLAPKTAEQKAKILIY